MSVPAERDALDPKRRRKTPKKINEQYLRNVALWYMERYASSAANLKRVLMRRVRESSAFHGTDPAAGAALVDTLIARYREAGILNDALFAETRARSLFQRGNSIKMIRRKLMEKGIAAAEVEAALAALAEDDNGDLAAAARYVRRRRIGPYRTAEKRGETRDRDIAALARQGFSFDIAAKVVDAEDAEILEDLL